MLQYNSFFEKHSLDVTGYILDASRQISIDYVSSPEIGFLKGLNGKLRRGKTKLIFRFLDEDAVEPSANQTYSSLLKDLKMIKSFASGILVPKNYIWPVTKDQYLEPPTTLVADAHGLGLEVYAYNFANDAPASYNYSFDPTAEYLQFIDNSNFSVDGVLTDFPSTASEAVGERIFSLSIGFCTSYLFFMKRRGVLKCKLITKYLCFVAFSIGLISLSSN